MLDDASDEMVDDVTDESSGSESECECSESYESSFVTSDSSDSESEWNKPCSAVSPPLPTAV